MVLLSDVPAICLSIKFVTDDRQPERFCHNFSLSSNRKKHKKTQIKIYKYKYAATNINIQIHKNKTWPPPLPDAADSFDHNFLLSWSFHWNLSIGDSIKVVL